MAGFTSKVFPKVRQKITIYEFDFEVFSGLGCSGLMYWSNIDEVEKYVFGGVDLLEFYFFVVRVLVVKLFC